MTTNEPSNDTRGYQILPTNFTCSMISGFGLKGQCSPVRGKTMCYQCSHILIIAVKFYQ